MPLYISEKREVIAKDELSETKKDRVKKKEKKEKLFILAKKENKTKTGKK